MSSVKKSGYNAHQKYHYATENDILDTVRSELVKHNIFIFCSVEDTHMNDNITTVKIKYTFVDGDSGEEFVIYGSGQGADKQDKGIYKAITGCHKYMFMKNFLMETNDDPENDGLTKPAANKAPATPTTKTFEKATSTTEIKEKPKFGAKKFSA